MSSPAAIANHIPLDSQTPAQRFDAFDASRPSGLLRERWKYSRLTQFADALHGASATDALRAEFAPADAVHIRRVEPDSAPPLSNADWSDTYQWQAYPLADGVVSKSPGWQADIAAKSQISGTLRLQDGLGHGLVSLGESAQAELSLDCTSHAATLAVLQFEIAANASLTLDTIALDASGLSWLLTRFTLGEHARLVLRAYFAGAGTHRHETHVVMAGSGAEADLTGAAIGRSDSRFDQQLVMEHTAPHCNSEQRYHCVGLPGTKSSFNGRIHIHPGARATVAQLNNRNLALASDAEMNTKPELEIYNDDVRCAHGATVGQLDNDALYYCQSRGIPPSKARALLTAGFLQQCVAGPHADAVSEAIRARIA